MKSKNTDSQPATKTDLKIEINQLESRLDRKFATKKDLIDLEERLEKRFEKKFATKEDLKSFASKDDLKTEVRGIEFRFDLKLDTLKREVNDKAQLYRDQILTRIDKFAKEIEDSRIDRAVGTHQVSELRKITDNHEQRIKKIEKSQTV